MAGKGKRTKNGLINLQSRGKVAMHDLNRLKQLRETSLKRLERDVTEIRNQQVSSMVSIKRDQRRLKEKLLNVRHSTGHYTEGVKNAKGLRGGSIQKDDTTMGSGASTEQQNIPGLPSLVTTDDEKDISKSIDTQALENDPASKQFESKIRSSSFEGESKRSSSRHLVHLPDMSKLSRSEITLNSTAWYSDLSQVRSMINKRLSISMNELNKGDSEKELEPYLYAPSDGLPRTKYLMPSMDERYKQAMKARYIRKPGTRIDPIERELNLKEVFEPNSHGE